MSRAFVRLLAMLLCLVCFLSPIVTHASETDDWEVWLDIGEDNVEMTPEEEARLEELGAIHPQSISEIDPTDLECNSALPGNVMSILLLGIDNRTVSLASGRSDANLICSVDLGTGAITLTTLSRDMGVSVPGYQNLLKLNTVFKFGSENGDFDYGARLAIKSVNRTLDMNVSHYVVINIHGLADIIEALGGLDIDITAAEATAINYELFIKEPMDSNRERSRLVQRDGVQHLDGMQAVTYGRIRNLKGQSDLDRNDRQRKLLQCLLEKALDDLSIAKLLMLIETSLPYAVTDLTLEEMLRLGTAVLFGEPMQRYQQGRELLSTFSIPMEKHYGYQSYGDGTMLVMSDNQRKETIDILHEMLFNRTFSEQ